MKLPILKDPYKDADPAALGVGSVDLVNGWFDATGTLRRRPGLLPWEGYGLNAPVDALYWWDYRGMLVSVCQGRVVGHAGLTHDITVGATVSPLGGAHPLDIVDGGHWLMAASNGQLHRWDGASGTLASYPEGFPVSHIAWLNGKFVAIDIAERVVRFTDYQGVESSQVPVWVDEYFTAESSPDPIRALTVFNGQLWLFGSRTVETWYDAGESPVPFVRVQGSHLDVGIGAVTSLVQDQEALYWLDDRSRVIRMAGGQLSILSAPIERFLRDLPGLSGARMFRVAEFLVVVIPDGVHTYACNLKTGGWSQWVSYDESLGLDLPWFGRCSAYVPEASITVVGLRDHGILALSKETYNTDLGALVPVRLLSGRLDGGTINRKRSNQLTVRLRRGD